MVWDCLFRWRAIMLTDLSDMDTITSSSYKIQDEIIITRKLGIFSVPISRINSWRQVLPFLGFQEMVYFSGKGLDQESACFTL